MDARTETLLKKEEEFKKMQSMIQYDLHMAVLKGDEKSVRSILADIKEITKSISEDSNSKDIFIPNLNIKNADGNTLLALAAKNGHPECLEILIQEGFRVNEPNTKQVSPLILAAEGKHSKCVGILLDAKADADYFYSKYHSSYPSNYNEIKTAISIAAKNGDTDSLEFLINKGAKKDFINTGETIISDRHYYSPPLFESILNGQTKAAKLLIESKVNLDQAVVIRDVGKIKPMAFAAKQGQAGILWMIIDAKPKLSKEEYSEAIHHAVNQNQVTCLRTLIQTKHKLDSQTKLSGIFLRYSKEASSLKYTECAEILKNAEVALHSEEKPKSGIHRFQDKNQRSVSTLWCKIFKKNEFTEAPMMTCSSSNSRLSQLLDPDLSQSEKIVITKTNIRSGF